MPAYRVDPRTMDWLDAALAAYALAHIAFVVVMFLNHWQFPLFLKRWKARFFSSSSGPPNFGRSIPIPLPIMFRSPITRCSIISPCRFRGFSARRSRRCGFTAFAGYAAAVLLSYLIVEGRTQSRWWGLIAAGLLCAAYRSMDAYLDTAHSDSWLLASVLLGTYLIDGGKSRVRSSIGYSRADRGVLVQAARGDFCYCRGAVSDLAGWLAQVSTLLATGNPARAGRLSRTGTSTVRSAVSLFHLGSAAWLGQIEALAFLRLGYSIC